MYFKKLAVCIGRWELGEDERYYPIKNLQANHLNSDLYDILCECFAEKEASEWIRILTEADLPFALAKNWEEMLEDPQAWENDCYHKMRFDNGNERVVVRPPVRFREMGVPEYNRAPMIGEHSVDILQKLGYTEEQVETMLDNGAAYTWNNEKASR